MREELVTPVWRALAHSLPPTVQKRYLQELKSAEGFDLALDRVLNAWKSLAEVLHLPPHHPAH
jgi:hypothetical protein